MTDTQIYDANRCAEVLDNEAFIAVFNDIEQEVTEQWKNSPARDEEGRQKLWVYLTVLRKVKAQLTQTFENGKMAAIELEHKRTLMERIGKRW
jgi:hypothetical protein